MARNSGVSETQVLNALERHLRDRLPKSWQLIAERPPRRGDRFDLELTVVAPDGNRARVIVEAKSRIEPRDVGRIAEAQKRLVPAADSGRTETALAVAAPHLTPLTRARLAERGVGWFDLTGNVHLEIDRPSLFVDSAGADRNPASEPEGSRLRSLRGRASARVVRALLVLREPTGVRALAARAGVSPATAAKTLELLGREDLIERDEDGNVTAVRKRSLAQRWAQDYGFTSTNRTQNALAPRGFESLLQRVDAYRKPVALTGSAALRAYLPTDEIAVTPMSLLTLYVADIDDALQALALRRAQRGANVVLAEPLDEAVLTDATLIEGRPYASPSQTVVDLLTSPGRGPAEADQLVEALAADDPGWSR